MIVQTGNHGQGRKCQGDHHRLETLENSDDGGAPLDDEEEE